MALPLAARRRVAARGPPGAVAGLGQPGVDVTEGAIGLWQGLAAGSIALTGWALGSAVEGLASVIVIWRFSGSRTLSQTAERTAQRGVAVSFWLLAPYIAAESVRDLIAGHHAETTVIGMALTAVALLEMPLLGPRQAQTRRPARLGRHRRGGHPELPVRRPGRRRAGRAGHHRRLARRMVARPRHRPGHRRRRRPGKASESWRGDDCC